VLLPQIKDLLFSVLRLQRLSLPPKNLCIAGLELFSEPVIREIITKSCCYV
jgi:hypothetical protein